LRHWNLPQPKQIRLDCRQILSTQAYYRPIVDKNKCEKDYFAIFNIIDENNDYEIGVYPDKNTTEPVPSVPYDEESLVKNSRINYSTKSISLTWIDSSTPIQKIFIALQKRLLTRLLPGKE